MSADPRIGTEVSGYRIERLLGRGGMSVVYLADDLALERKVALKLLAPELAEDERFRERFLSESRIAASIDHPNVIPIYGAGETDSVLYIAMRYVEGTDLRKLLDSERRLEPARALSLLTQTAHALDVANARGLVHRDVKPGNILIASGAGPEQPDHVYLSDFGLTKHEADGTSLTETGQFLGTIDYVAPEQIDGKELDGRADEYSLACVLYECLTGEVPYRSDSKVAVLFSHLQEKPPSVTERNQSLPEGLDRVVAKGMAKEPADRYQTSTGLATAVREALGLTGEPLPATAAPKRRGRWLIAAAILALLLVAGLAAGLALALGDSGGEARAGPVTSGTLVRIDPETNEVVSSSTLGELPNAVAASGEHVWVTDLADQSVRQFDTGGALVRQVDLGASPIGIAARGDLAQIPLVGPVPRPGLTTVSAITGELGREPEAADVWAIEAADSEVWVATSTGLGRLATGDGVQGGVEPRIAGVLRETVPVPTTTRKDPFFEPFTGIALSDRGTAWLIGDTYAPKLWRVDLDTGEVAATIDLPSVPHSVAATADTVWVTALLDDVVWRIDPQSNAIVTTIPVAQGAAGVDADVQGVWVANSLAGTVTRIDPRTNQVSETIEVGGRPVDVALGDGAVWVAADPAPSGGAAPDDRIAIGVIRECYGDIFGQFAAIEAAGAQLPLIQRGGVRVGADVTDGVEDVSVGGKPIQLVFACSDGTSEDPLNEARYLVEGEHVDVVIGATLDTEGPLLRDYAKRNPGVTFVNGTSGDQSTTLRQPAANYFRFLGDEVQWYAGLGAYAYNELGWRDAAVVGDDLIYDHHQAAGFIAEFCALGGTVVDRFFLPLATVPPSFVPEFPESVDGVFVINSPALLALADEDSAFTGNLADRVVGTVFSVNQATLGELGERLRGVVIADQQSSPPYERYAADLAEAFPEVAPLAGSTFGIAYSMAMEAILQALETVDGDLSDGQSRFQAALAEVELDSVYGRYRLDERRNAIGPTFLSRVEEGSGGLELRSFRVTEDVEQTFNGYFTPDSAPPSATEPECKHGNPPPWAVAGDS